MSYEENLLGLVPCDVAGEYSEREGSWKEEAVIEQDLLGKRVGLCIQCTHTVYSS